MSLAFTGLKLTVISDLMLLAFVKMDDKPFLSLLTSFSSILLEKTGLPPLSSRVTFLAELATALEIGV